MYKMMNMVFHTKQTNIQEKIALRKKSVQTTYKLGSEPNTNVKNMFASPMIERVVKAKSGCSACGR